MLRVSNVSSGVAASSVLRHAARTAVENGDRVASVSYSGVASASNLTAATYIKGIGGLLVWSAGNDSANLTLNNRDDDDIIVVGATDSGDNLASFSAYGPFVDLVAPGVAVTTTSNSSDSSYASVSGTSFSCPLTAGLAALIWSADPALTPDDVELRLKQGCDDLGTAGVDNTFGYGRINAYSSMAFGACPSGEILDCNGNCGPVAWIGDNTCDNGARLYGGNLIDFSCSQFYWDDIDCPVPTLPSILWRNVYNNLHAVWFMDGEVMQPETGLLPSMPSSTWAIAGTGDFDGNTYTDILWRDSATGQNRIWFMIGTSLIPDEQVLTPAGTAWTVVATEDFDNDGKCDIFWRSTSGQNAMWFLDGTTLLPATGLLPTVGSVAWQVVGAGDFDGDTFCDVLWRQAYTGQDAIWFMDGTLVPAVQLTSTVSTSWQVNAVTDFDLDGKSDILWRNIYTGASAVWFMDATTLRPETGLLPPASVVWQMVGVADFDRDNDPDILWRNTANGQNFMWFMQGTSLSPTGAFTTTVSTAWSVIGAEDD